MKEIFSHTRAAVIATLVLAVVCCGLYPLVVFGIALSNGVWGTFALAAIPEADRE